MASNSRLPSARRPAGGAGKSRPVSMIEGSVLSNLPTLTSNNNNENDSTKKSKRRSLLPQFSRKASVDEKADAGIKEEEEETQGSGSRTGSEDTRGSGESLGRKAIDEDRNTMPPPSRLSRPASMVPPRGTSQFARLQTQPHGRKTPDDKEEKNENARAESLAALTGARSVSPSKLAMPEAGVKRSGSSRLPQSPKIGAPVIPSRASSTRNTNSHTRGTSSMTSFTPKTIPEERSSKGKQGTGSASTRTSEEEARPTQRSSVTTRARPQSQIISSQQPQTSMMSRGRPGSQMPPPTSTSNKPAFNTYQQHYSPAKTSGLPKPPLPSQKPTHKTSPSTAEEELPITFETTKAQTELLQLSLLHATALQTTTAYTATAKKKLAKHHTKLRRDYETLRASELVHQRRTNLSALEAWCPDPSMLVENLQILSLVYSDLTALIEPSSRHEDVVSMFDLWAKEAEAPLPGTFIQPLPDEWRTAHASLGLKLRGISRTLGVLPALSKGEEGDGSGLGSVLRWCRSLVEGLLRELEVMGRLERELLERQGLKVEEEVRGLVVGEDVGVGRWRPVWESVWE